MQNNNFISEQYIINKYLKKLNFKKKETYNFENDASFLKSSKNKKIIVTNDTIIESVDFFKSDPPESIANKIITYNLSDISSMGASPYAYTLSLALPMINLDSWLNKFTKKLFFLQKKYNFFLIGGDLSKSNKIIISSNFFGYVNKEKVLSRSNNNINDDIWITGNIGESTIGLKIIKNKIKVNLSDSKYFSKKYLFPKHFAYGHRINKYANSAIDISDGFYGDLNKLIFKKNKGALIHSKSLPFSNRTKKLLKNNVLRIQHLLSSGDDYELIFTADPNNFNKIIKLSKLINVKITKVGTIIEKKGIYMDNEKVKFINKSFDHFS